MLVFVDCELEIWVCPDHTFVTWVVLSSLVSELIHCTEFLIIITGRILPASEDTLCRSLFKSISNTSYQGLQRTHLAPRKCVSSWKAMFSLGGAHTFSVRWK